MSEKLAVATPPAGTGTVLVELVSPGALAVISQVAAGTLPRTYVPSEPVTTGPREAILPSAG